MHKLELSNVDSGYNKNAILHNVNFVAQESSIYVVLGPNGAGKTTLFRTIAGILEPYAGSVSLDGENISDFQRSSKAYKLSFTFQCHP